MHHFRHTHGQALVSAGIKLLLFVGILFSLLAMAPITQAAVTPDSTTNFITTWNTENDGTSANNQITIPGAGGGYNYEIYWEDTASSTVNGTTTLIATNSHTLTFPAPGIYEVQVSGTFPRIYFNNGGDKEKILTVEQWGDIAWSNMRRAFHGASNLRIPATDAPNLSGVMDMNRMFHSARVFNDPIGHWDVASVTRMDELFKGASLFNQPLNTWDVSKVANMRHTFLGASAFNQPLDSWDVSLVQDMGLMFRHATVFNQPLNTWNVSSVLSMDRMFSNAIAFN